MLFITQVTALPGHYSEMIRLCKHPKIHPDVTVKSFYGMFGKPDLILIFEASSERVAADFVMQFSQYADIQTSVAFPAERLKWTR